MNILRIILKFYFAFYILCLRAKACFLRGRLNALKLRNEEERKKIEKERNKIEKEKKR